ncbi:MAG TPA: hypothetical protein VFY89_06420, partial [Ktedonobacterales bacterium]
DAAAQFCGNLKAQNYDSAYSMLSSKLRGQYTSAQYRAASAQLDAAEGRVTACGTASGSGSYNYSLGGSKAAVTAAITREKLGALRGGVHLVNEAGGWKVDALDTSLLGVHLGALGTLDAFCANLTGQNYTVVYGLLGSSLQSALQQDDFIAQAKIHDEVDGKVTTCTLTAVTPGSNTDTAAAVRVAITRSKLGVAAGDVALRVESGDWKVTQLETALQGSDLEPLLTGIRFCNSIVAGAWQDAYALLSSHAQQEVPLAKFKSTDYFGLPSGIKYVSCTPNLDTYKASPDGGPYDSTVKLENTATGATGEFILRLFIRPFSVGWRVNGWGFFAAGGAPQQRISDLRTGNVS